MNVAPYEWNYMNYILQKKFKKIMYSGTPVELEDHQSINQSITNRTTLLSSQKWSFS
jgi:hypothetical protein